MRIDTVNGFDPEQVKNRPEFGKLTPLYPQERLKLETTPIQLVGPDHRPDLPRSARASAA